MFQAVCRSKHVEPSMNGGIINSITKLHLVGISTQLYYLFMQNLRILTAVIMTVFYWDATLHISVDKYQHFEEIYSF